MSEFVGTYVFRYPSGEVEVLFISSDSTYRKDIYATYDDYKHKSTPKYSNEGRWSISKKNELEFDGWLMYNKNRDPSFVLPVPSKSTMLNVGWRSASYGRKAVISVYEETGYVFEKTD
jgi:hypothetical protein